MKYAKLFDTAFRDVTAFGGFIFYGFVLLLSLGNLGLFIRLLIGLAVMVAVVVLIRSFYFKQRPKKQSYSNFLERIDAASFPSLHTARAVFLALVFSPANAILVSVMAVLVAYSRIYLKKHDWIDVLFGGLLGWGVYWVVGLI